MAGLRSVALQCLVPHACSEQWSEGSGPENLSSHVGRARVQADVGLVGQCISLPAACAASVVIKLLPRPRSPLPTLADRVGTFKFCPVSPLPSGGQRQGTQGGGDTEALQQMLADRLLLRQANRRVAETLCWVAGPNQ